MKQRRGIRRIVIRAGIFLLLGAIANIAVAWGATRIVGWHVSPLSGQLTRVQQQESIDWWCQHAPSGYVDAPAFVSDWRQPGARMLTLFGIDGGKIANQFAYRMSWGWPALSLELTIWSKVGTPTRTVSTAIHIGTTLLPLMPLWPGFAINTLFYTAILWLLFALPGALRRRRRIKRGLCPACAYPVGASDLCTECGKPVNPRSVELASP